MESPEKTKNLVHASNQAYVTGALHMSMNLEMMMIVAMDAVHVVEDSLNADTVGKCMKFEVRMVLVLEEAPLVGMSSNVTYLIAHAN